jgi:hypothetical protein
MLTQERLKELLDYDPETGVFTRLIDVGGGNVAGKVAGTISGTAKKPKRQIWVDGKCYSGHRLAWLWMTGSFPANQVDHKNLDRLDNRWTNLREATNSQNRMNTRGRGESGAKGVFYRKDPRSVRRWRALIIVEGKRHNLGHFETREEAQAAYAAAAPIFHGEFARVA